MESKEIKRQTRHKRIRAKVRGTSTRPRLAVFKSNRAIYAQIIDDERGVTLASARSKQGKNPAKGAAREVGKTVAENAKSKNIKAVVFDRGGYIYTGAVKELAEGAREAGLVF